MTVLRTVLIAALFFAGAGTLALEGWLQRIQERDLVQLERDLEETLEARCQAEDEFDTVVYELLYGPGNTDFASDPAPVEELERENSPDVEVIDEVVVSVTFAAFLDEHRDVLEGAPGYADEWRERPIAMAGDSRP